MEKQQNANLSLRLRACPKSWSTLVQLSPAAHKLLHSHPHVAAIELSIGYSPEINVNNSILIGSPNAWIIEEGKLTAASDICLTEGLAEALWHVGREASYSGLKYWLDSHLPIQTNLVSLLILPDIFCFRDNHELETLAEVTWTNELTHEPNLQAIGYCLPIEPEHAYRLRAQSRHISEIYSADLGIPVHLKHAVLERQKTPEKKT